MSSKKKVELREGRRRPTVSYGTDDQAGPESGGQGPGRDAVKRKVGEAQRALFQFSALLSARVRERRPAFFFCQKAALWCGCAGCALSRGKADLRRTAKTALALAPGRPDR